MKKSPLLLLIAVAAFALSPTLSAHHPSDPLRNLKGTYTVRLVPATSFSVLNPTLSELSTAPRQDFLRVGALTFDGAGHVTGRIAATTDDNSGATLVKNFRVSGTYNLDSQGFGTLSIQPVSPAASGEDITDEGAETYALKLNDRARMVHLIQTDNVGGGAKVFLTGDAFLDRPLSKGGHGGDDDDDD